MYLLPSRERTLFIIREITVIKHNNIKTIKYEKKIYIFVTRFDMLPHLTSVDMTGTTVGQLFSRIHNMNVHDGKLKSTTLGTRPWPFHIVSNSSHIHERGTVRSRSSTVRCESDLLPRKLRFGYV